MKRRKHIPFYVIIDNVNRQDFERHDVMPYLVSCYDDAKKRKEQPKTYEEFKAFVKGKSMYMFFARCQYELVLKPWVGHSNERKVDVHWQLMHNLDLATSILMLNLGFKENNGL